MTQKAGNYLIQQYQGKANLIFFLNILFTKSREYLTLSIRYFCVVK